MNPPPSSVTATIQLTIGGRPMDARVTVSTGPTTLDDFIPMARGLANAIVGLAEEDVEEAGRKISCKAGCGACCRQLVPLPPVEARRIRDLVEALPEPRKSVVRERFAEARRRIVDAGMLEGLLDPEKLPVTDSQTEIGMRYFRLGIPCPFLEDESCSIHPDRPVVCREYLVTSDPVYCSAPTAQTVDVVTLATKVSRAILAFGIKPGKRYVDFTALPLALEWADRHPDDLPSQPGPELLKSFFGKLMDKNLKIPDPPGTMAGDSAPPVAP